jgi:hypothetical protein
MHIVSEVTGTLREGLTYADVLRATFPAGTVSGAPKIRALELISELEPMKRNVYAGAIGYLGWHGDADTAIAIRTAVIQDGTLHVQAGGGIVFDSDPAKEWEETMNKGRALFRAVAQAAGGLWRHAALHAADRDDRFRARARLRGRRAGASATARADRRVPARRCRGRTVHAGIRRRSVARG